jgi:heme/copper-type cytochrome/quinol oxidase subunit 4
MTLLSSTVTKVWLVLVVVTVTTTWVLTEHGIPAELAVIAIMLLAAVKVGLILWHFMELRDAPVVAQAAFGTWVVAVVAIVLGFYAATGS